MVEIYINNKIVELSQEQDVQFSIKSNFMGALDDIQASRTYTVTLPATKNNMAIIGMANDVTSLSAFRYKKFPADIFIDGFLITNSAKAYLVSVKESSFDIIIAWNTSNAFTKFGSDNLTDIIEKFPALYDYLRYDSTMSFNKPVSETSDTKGYFWYNNRLPDRDNTTVKYHHPCVSAKYILNKIIAAYGINIVGIDLDDFNDYLFPLVTNKACMETMIYQGLSSSDNVWISGTFPHILMPHNDYRDYKTTQVIDVFRPDGWYNYSSNNSFYSNKYADSFRFQCHFKCAGNNILVFAAWNAKTHSIGDTFAKFTTDANHEINIDETIKYGGDFRIYFMNADVYQIGIYVSKNFINNWVTSTYFKITPLYEKTLFYDKINVSNRDGRFDIMANLPDMKVSEFVADFCAIIGAYPSGNGDDLGFVFYNEITNKSNSLDWSSKFVSIKDTNYIHDKSGKEITFGLDNDDYSFDGSAIVTVDSDIVDDKTNFFDAVLTNMNGYLLQLYSKSFDQDNLPVFDLNDMSPKIGYKTIVDGTKLGCTGISEQTIFKPYFELQGLLETKYKSVSDALKSYQMITADMYIKPSDICDVSSGRPVFISKLGSFFMVTSIEYSTSNYISEVEMIKLN